MTSFEVRFAWGWCEVIREEREYRGKVTLNCST